MPKSDPDHELQCTAQLAIRKHRSIEEAANAVGLSPSTLWRVAKSGRTIPRTRAALDAWRSRLEVNEINEMTPLEGLSMSRQELLQMRGALVSMLQFLDRCIDARPNATTPTH